MAAALDTLRTDIEAAERAVRVADQRAANTGRALRASWRAKGPTIMGAAGAALLLRQVLRARRRCPGIVYAARAWVHGFARMGPTWLRSVRRR